MELGTKWNRLDDKLLATSAVFQARKSDAMEGANYDTVGTFNTVLAPASASSQRRLLWWAK